MRKRLRIFISSPADVNEERLRAHLVIQKLARDYARFFEIEAYLWEHEPMLASGHFQDAIDPPSASDIVLLIVYARLGTPLPEHTATRPYHGIDGRTPVTGTEWEFEEALAANRLRGAPDLLAYRKTGDPGLSLTDATRRAEQERQWQGLEAFWRRHFEDAGMFIAGSSRFATVEEFDKRLETDLTALIERRIGEDLSSGGAPEGPRWLKGSPFRGLAAYEFEDADIFFGRDAQTRLALTRLQGAAEQGCAFLLVLGASGSGKSSLARAGVLPALFVPKAIPGVGAWRRIVARPADGGDDPIRRLAAALASGDPAKGVGLPEMLSPGASVEALAAHLAASADDPTYPYRLALDRVAEQGRAARRMLPHESSRLVILVDQLEELFTRGIDPARRDLFLRILTGLAKSGLVWIVATMRSDLWHRAADAKLLVDLVETGARVDLPRPDGAEVIEIIRRPAAAAGIAFDVDSDSGVALDAVIARAAAEEPGVLPLLSVLLDTLYERDVLSPRPGAGRANMLTFATYRELGELKGAIARRADQALSALREHDAEAAAALPRVLRALVTVSQSGDAITARPARLDAFAEGSPEARLISAFLAPDARLLVGSSSVGGSEIRLAHEALLENWPTARAQVQNDRRDIETRARLEALHRRWRDAPAAADKSRALLRGLNLAEGADLMARWSIDQNGELGTFVRTSARAERLRRSWFAASAAALAVIFAGIAGFAALESRRAEREAVGARNAEQAERGAREVAVQQRSEAERQRDRADGERGRAVASEQRAVAALRATQRQSARTLAAQAEVAASRNEFRRALTLAVNAAETEREALDPGMPAASEPALLKAMADVRQVLHVRRPAGPRSKPYALLGDDLLVHVDETGVVVTSLTAGAQVTARASVPEGMVPSHVAAIRSANLIAVGGSRRLLLIDARDGQLRGDFRVPSRITALDAHEGSGRFAVATIDSIMLVDPATQTLSEPIRVETGADRAVGQVRFSRDGRSLYATVGVRVLEYDLIDKQFREAPKFELDATPSGIDKPMLEIMLAPAIIVVVELIPDLTRNRLLVRHPAGLTGQVPGKPTIDYEREDPALRFLGVSFADQSRTGSLAEAIAVMSRPGDTEQEILLRYVSDDSKLMTFDRFVVTAADATGEKFDTCKVSLHVTYVVCQYWGKSHEGLVAFRLLGGAHRFARVFGRGRTAWGEIASPGRVLVGDPAGLFLIEGGGEAKVGELPAGWTAVALHGASLVARANDEMAAWKVGPDAQNFAQVLAPVKASQLVMHSMAGRALAVEADRLSVLDLVGGRRLVAVPGLAGLRGAAFSPGADKVGALTEAAVYLFDAATGRLESSIPVETKDGAFALDGELRRLAYVDAQGSLRLLGLQGKESIVLREKPAPIALLAWAPDGERLVIGHRDGAIEALGLDGKSLWVIASPLGAGFNERSSWPNQPPKGLVRAITFSTDGERLAVIRQDMPSIDLHEAASGRYLTRVSTPWAFGVPVRVTLGSGGAVLSTWALHPMAQDKPSHVSLHALPFGLDAALAAAKDQLRRIETVWTPEAAR